MSDPEIIERLEHIARRVDAILAILEEREKPRLLPIERIQQEMEQATQKKAIEGGRIDSIVDVRFVRCPHCNGTGRTAGMDCSVCLTLGKVPALHNHKCPGCAVVLL